MNEEEFLDAVERVFLGHTLIPIIGLLITG